MPHQEEVSARSCEEGRNLKIPLSMLKRDHQFMTQSGSDLDDVSRLYWMQLSGRDDAPHIGHRRHLCDLAERGEISIEQMKALVRDPKFICNKCGRVAAKEENLCDPVPL